MISIDQAILSILENIETTPSREVPLSAALGSVLAQDVVSDIDSPPFDKALMDGYAVRAEDVTQIDCELTVVEEIMAGNVPSLPVGPGQATRIMTGSPVPEGADTIVVIENTTQKVDGKSSVVVHQYPVESDKNILRQGTCLAENQVVLTRGTRLSAGQLGLLAEIGKDPVPVFSRPTVAILATGNELVPPASQPAPGQIRNSNGPMLRGMVEADGATPVDIGIGRDDPEELQRLIRQGLECHVLILSGGVSAGDLDLVPRILSACEVREVFHKVQLKPGKPLWFGVGDQSLVFGLPGNPVSSFVCYRLFVSLAIQALQGLPIAGIALENGRLSSGHAARGNRTVFFPARITTDPPTSESWLELLPWHGSADLRTLAVADCLAELPAGTNIDDGGSVRFVRL